jgi:signal transduction histidine kinase
VWDYPRDGHLDALASGLQIRRSNKTITALASLPTAFLLLRLVPQAMALPSPEQLRIANRSLEREIADRKIAEKEIRTLNMELERRVAERTQELMEANERLKRMNDDLTHFAYAASHDLQEPLRMVVIYNKLLVKNFCG